MNLKGKLFTIIFIGFASILSAQQCPAGGALFVNEIFNDDGSQNEYMELVVLGDPADPTAPVNLEGWIIDDNNFVGVAGQGTAKGHLKLDATFSSVNPGAIILIYNELVPYSPLPASNPPWLYVIAGSDIDGCSDAPDNSNSNPDYTPCGTAGGSWSYTLLNNVNDVVQTRHPDATFYHGIDWGPPLTIIPSITVDDKTVSLDCGDWFDPDNYVSLPETPGDFNSELNEALIMSIRNGTLDCDDIEASCVLFTCPEISAIDFVDEICAGETFDIIASGLVNMAQSQNAEADFGIEFVRFDGSTPPSDPYIGGNAIGIVDHDNLNGTSPDQTASLNTNITDEGTYQICAILEPESAEPDCRPFACKTIIINGKPQVSLSGTQSFCPNDCFEINTSITGGTSPYTIDLVLQAGPINFPLNIPSYDVDNHLTICYDASGFIPSYDEASNTLHFPTFLTGSGTITITSLVDQKGCVPDVIDPDFMTLVFNSQPSIFNAGPLEGCDSNGDGEAWFDLTTLESTVNGGSGNTVNWYEDSNGTIPINDAAAYYSGAGNVYVNVQDDNCTSDIIAIQLIVVTAPNPGENVSIDICSGENTSLNFYLELGGDPGGIWNDDSDSGVDLTDPASVEFSGIPSGTYDFSYIFLANGPCPDTSAILTVNVVESLNPGNDNQIGICFGSDTPVDLDEALGEHDPGGDWSDDSGIGIDLSDPTAVDFSTIPVGDYDFRYTFPGNGICPNQEAMIIVSIYEEPNAGSDGTLQVCNGGSTIIDLEAALGQHDNIGYWTDVDGTGVQLNPADEVDFNGIAPGTYHFQYTIPETENCPEVSAVITVNVLEGSYAGQDSLIQFCQGFNAGIDLFSIIEGVTDSTGTWQQLSGDPLDLSDPFSLSIETSGPGIDTLLYLIDNSCGIDTAVVLLEIIPALVAGSDYTTSVCLTIDTINLYDSLGIYDLGGTWLNDDLDTITNVNSLSFGVIDTFNYYYIVGNALECGFDTAKAIIEVIPPVYAGKDTSVFICEGADLLFDLTSLVASTSDTSGIWLQIAGESLDLSAPDSIDLSNASIGIDSILYIVEGPCNVDTALVILSIDDAPNAGLDYNLSVCGFSTGINLFDSLADYTPGGNWFYEDGDILVDPFNFNIDSVGTILLNYILPANGTCAADTAVAVINIDKAPYAGTDATVIICEGSLGLINMYDQLNDTPDINGEWVDIDATGLNLDNWDQISFESLLTGVYQFGYIVSPETGSTCEADTSILSIEIITGPNPGTNNSFNLCQGEYVRINLDSLLLDHDPTGVWSDIDFSGVDLTDPENIDISILEPGTYRFSYIIAPMNGCPSAQALITLNILASADAGQDIYLSYCEGYAQPIDLYEQLDPDVLTNGTWIDPQFSGVDLSDPAVVFIDDLLDGSYTLQYLIMADPSCGTDTSNLEITIENAFETGFCDTVYVCNGPSEDPVDFFEVLTGEDSGGEFRELTSSGANIDNPGSVSFEGIIDGRYIFEYFFPATGNCPELSTRIYIKVLRSTTSFIEQSICPNETLDIGGVSFDLDNPTGEVILTNSIGCDSIVTVNLSLNEISILAEHEDANCFDLASIIISGINGTSLPVSLESDSLGLMQIQSLPYTIGDITAGNYDFSVYNSFGCTYDTTLVVEPFDGFVFEMEEVVDIVAGQSYPVSIITDLDAVTVEWFPQTGLDCYDCLNPVASPVADTEYTVTLIDEEGCILTGTVLFRVKTEKSVFIPNAFSPNGDAFNDRFYVKSNQNKGTYEMSIFDRWGELIFTGSNLVLDDDQFGWDGRFNSKLLNPGVYVYHVVVNYNDGETQTISGDVLLLR
jgi:gliding motility-associated-like protein